jgi:apolipoprotein N-acyltransferase
LVLLSAVLQIVIFPLPNLYPLCWVALAPLLVALVRAQRPDTLQLTEAPKLLPASPWQGFVLGYVCGILWYSGTCYWIYATMHQYGGMSAPVALLVLLLFCMYLGLYHALFGLLVSLVAGRGDSLRRVLVAAPFLWVFVELGRTRITGFNWNLLGIAQVDNIPLARIAGATGVYGLSFEIMLVNTALAAAFLVRREKRNVLLVVGLLAAVVLQTGRWIKAPASASDHMALLVQENVPVLEGADWTKTYFTDTLQELQKLSIFPPNVAPRHFDLIVWPESPAPFYTGDAFFRGAVSEMARRTKTWVIVGSIGVRNSMETPLPPMQLFNSAALVSPQGEWTARYDKMHLVPFGEYVPFPHVFAFAGGLTAAVGDFAKGTSRAALDVDGTKVGVFICYESIFPDEVRQFAKNGAEVLVNISNDGWYGDSGAYAQHLAQTRMRAIENGRWILSATNTGVTASIDPYGRVVVRAERKIRTAMPAPYALTSVTTFYTRHGDWFSYLCAIISVGALFMRFLQRQSREQSW